MQFNFETRLFPNIGIKTKAKRNYIILIKINLFIEIISPIPDGRRQNLKKEIS
jgi:hypothetical protein